LDAVARKTPPRPTESLIVKKVIMKTIIFDLDGTLVRLKPKFASLCDRKTLLKLSDKYELALVTGSTRKEALSALRRVKILDLFKPNKIVTYDEVLYEKKSGKPFFEIKKRIELPAIMIGDSDGDEIGSQKATFDFIKVEQSKGKIQQSQNLLKAISKIPIE